MRGFVRDLDQLRTLDALQDARHFLDYLDRVVAHGGFPGQHDGIGPVHNGVRNVVDLGPGRCKAGDHGFHHLGSDNHRDPGPFCT